MDKKTLHNLLDYKKSLLKTQILTKEKYRAMELSLSKNIAEKRKRFLSQSIQSLMTKAMRETQLEIKILKEKLHSFYTKK